ncbi:MAG: OmpH family outer membrane protein [Phycisphaerales bacterium]|nr:OmpH family outer membrane protein [Phycisphaerales bacterium]
MNLKIDITRGMLVGLCLVLLVALIGNSRTDATQGAPATKTAVAVVNLEKTFNGLEEWTAAESQIIEMGATIEDEATRRREMVEGLFADTEDYPVGSEKFKEAQRKYEIAALEFQAYVAMHQSRRMEFNDYEIRRIYEKIKSSAQQMADERGIELILVDDSVVPIPPNTTDILAQISSRRVLFARTQLDITDALITQMNTAFRAAGS